MSAYLDLGTIDGDLRITEDQLKTITDEELKKLEITREDLHRCFVEGQRLMQEGGVTEGDRVRPVADQLVDGTWEVSLVQYSPVNDPLMQGDEGTAH